MRKNTHANTMRFQDASLGQEGQMIMENASTVIPGCAFISKQGGVKREIIVISIMEVKKATAGHQFHTLIKDQILCSPMISMEIGKIQMFRLWQEVFMQNKGPTHLIRLF